jgi:hypothetical protein
MAKARTLYNGSLGDPFGPYRGEKKLTVAGGWAPWWISATEDDPDWKNRRPVFSKHTMDGRPVQQLSTPFGTHVAGLWQQVPTAPGNRYEYAVEGQAWSSEDTAPGSQLESSDVNLQIGVDPTGGLDADSPLVSWGDAIQPLSRWETLRLAAVAESSIMTLYLKSAPNLPKRLQSIFWRDARLRPIGRYKRSISIVGAGDTHILVEPEHPRPGESVTALVSSRRQREVVDLFVISPDHRRTAISLHSMEQDEDRFTWRYEFTPEVDGLYDVRFVEDGGARLLALRLLRVALDVQIVPTDSARLEYERIYVLLPPTANAQWLLAAARGSFDGRYTIGFSADDAGVGDLEHKHVLAVNPHHWPEVLTAAWFQLHYTGVRFTAVVANSPEDLEAWLRNWQV